MHPLYTEASDELLFNAHVLTFENLGRTFIALKNSVSSKLSQFEQILASNRLLISEELNKISDKLKVPVVNQRLGRRQLSRLTESSEGRANE